MKALTSAVLVAALVLGVVTPSVCGDGGEGKSLRKALLLSMALPGGGQYYLGNDARAKVMFVSEAGVWAAFTGLRIQGRMRENTYEEMAELFAGVEGGHDDDYYLMMAHYISSEEYNIDVLREARYRFPGDRDSQLEYLASNGYFGTDAWEWESTERMLDFRRTRTDSRDSYRRATLTTGFAVLNRLISMVDVYLTFKLGNAEKQTSVPHLRVEQGPTEGFRVFVSMPL
jgi:hypothetical protein